MRDRCKNQLNHILGVLSAMSILCMPLGADAKDSILQKLKTMDTISATVPSNGDQNPYGLVRVPRSMGKLREGHYLVSNFNASSNLRYTPCTGALFGLIFDPEDGLVFVDDATNTLNLLH